MTSQITKKPDCPVCGLPTEAIFIGGKVIRFVCVDCKKWIRPCFGIGKRGSTKECETCKDSEACYEECEARAEHYYMVG